MDNTYIILGAIVVFGTLVIVAAYLYRESALASGKGEINVLGLFTIKLEGKAQKQADSPTPPPGVRENIVVDESRIDTVEGVEISKNVVADESSITVRERKTT